MMMFIYPMGQDEGRGGAPLQGQRYALRQRAEEQAQQGHYVSNCAVRDMHACVDPKRGTMGRDSRWHETRVAFMRREFGHVRVGKCVP